MATADGGDLGIGGADRAAESCPSSSDVGVVAGSHEVEGTSRRALATLAYQGLPSDGAAPSLAS